MLYSQSSCSRWTVGSLIGLIGLIQSIHLATAHSTLPPPLHPRALVHPAELSHHIIPRTTTRTSKDRRSRSSTNKFLTARSASASFDDYDEQLSSSNEGDRLQLNSTRLPGWNDRFLLSFLIHEDEPITIALKPSRNLVHPDGIKSTERHFDEVTQEWKTVEFKLEREEVKAYEGWVLREGLDVEKYVREEMVGLVRPEEDWQECAEGWARIMVEEEQQDDGRGGLRFQGAFMRGDETFTVHSTERYLRTKDPLDPEISSRLNRRGLSTSSDMVIVREREILTPEERINLIRKRGLSSLPDPDTLPSPSCSHDQLPFNTDPSHPVLSNAASQSLYAEFHSPWVPFLGLPSPSISAAFEPADRSTPHSSSSNVLRRHAKRQSGDISGGSGTSSNFINSIGSTQGCPKSAMVVFVGAAADCTYVETYGSTDAARRQILADFNSVSALYQSSFNIAIGIVELAVMSGTCPTTSSAVDQENPWNLPCATSDAVGGGVSQSSIGIDLNARLSVFSQWRGDKGGGDGAGLWHLLSACQTGSEVGVAWLGQLCRVTATSSGGQTTSGTGVTAITRNEWQVVAHEIGHNFGAIHDCREGCSLSDGCCPLSTSTCDAQANYIMSPVSSKNVSTFSPCSIGNICSTIGNSLNTTCIRDQGASNNPRVISEQSCGNGIVEEGEECDPGSANSACCDPETCRFRSGAVCDPINSLCCTDSCQVASSGTVCRPSLDGRCDKEETCDGSSSSCPDDETEPDGKSCGNGLNCATGVCTSQDLQCRNAGTSIQLTEACPSYTGCSITCNDPTRRGCVVLDQAFRDGTNCGYGGRCRNGECASGNAIDTAKSWYTQNLRISIPVTVVVGIIVLLILWALIRCCCCGGRRGRGGSKPPKGKPFSSNYSNGYGGGQYPQNGMQGGYYAPPPGPPPRAMVSNVLRR